MGGNSTSTMLGRLAVGQKKPRIEGVLEQKSEEVGEDFVAPQFKPSNKCEMNEVLTHILGATFSKSKDIPR